MARRGWIKVKVESGSFPSERAVTFEAGGKRYHLIVDEKDVDGDRLEVDVVAVNRDEKKALVDLPRETFTSGNRVYIPEQDMHLQEA